MFSHQAAFELQHQMKYWELKQLELLCQHKQEEEHVWLQVHASFDVEFARDSCVEVYVHDDGEVVGWAIQG